MTPTVPLSRLDSRLDELILAQAVRTPAAVAAICGRQSLSYAELDQRSAALAQDLTARGAAPGTLVGIHLDRSLDLLVAILAILRTGAAYLPLDPDFPAERLAFMVEDSATKLVLSQAALAGAAPPGDYKRIEIDDVAAGSSVAAHGGSSADPIYVLYTSGSTGKPKGVVLEHRNVVNFLLSMQQQPGLAPHDRLLAVTTLSFDISGLELLLPLITGATVVIATREQATDGGELKALVAEHAITVMQATPTTWRLMLEAGWQPSPAFKVLVGGEALPADLARTLAASCGEVWNMYGPTETAIWSTCYRVPAAGAPILIGKPIANTRVYILDKSMRRMPVGLPGEIFIAGSGVARGYLNREELTRERFLADPFAAAGERMYRTGDLGRYLTDGTLEFRQRADNQVKVRGFRIELGEVEGALAAHPGVKQAICAVTEVRPGDARLIAYVSAADGAGANGVSAADLREHLRRQLPQYMIPQHFVGVATFPLLPNGKIDRKQLPSLKDSGLIEDAYIAPATATEITVAKVFAEVLQVERVSAEANFFDLGGHSILAMRALTLLRRDCHAGLALRTIFEQAHVRELARAIDTLRATRPAPVMAAQTQDQEMEQFQF